MFPMVPCGPAYLLLQTLAFVGEPLGPAITPIQQLPATLEGLPPQATVEGSEHQHINYLWHNPDPRSLAQESAAHTHSPF